MPFDPTTFANLFAFSTFTTTTHLTFSGSGVWTALNTHACPVWTDPGHVLGSVDCPGWNPVPDPDAVDLSGVTALGADFLVARITDGSAVATFDVGSTSCKLEIAGGGCEYRDPDPALMIWQDSAGETLFGVHDDGTPTGSGPWEVDGLALTADPGGPDRLINPHPPTYFEMDPTNSANEILWHPDDFASLLWHWAPSALVFAGAAHDLAVTIGITLFSYIDQPPPVGFMCVL